MPKFGLLVLLLALLFGGHTTYRLLGATVPAAVVPINPHDTPEAQRHRQGQPNHWRAMVMQHS